MSLATVAIHESQFPTRIQQQLLASLGRREVLQKFHYDSLKQTQKWLALHQALSPALTDASCSAAYAAAFEHARAALPGPKVHVVGLGCGGGEKEARLLDTLGRGGREVSCTLVDVSVPLVLAARQAAAEVLGAGRCFPTVCDLAEVADWEVLLPAALADLPRVVTFFGLMPTLEAGQTLPQLGRFVRGCDRLLLSANLAPGADYREGVGRVLPQYDNPLTRDWLMTFLLDTGFEASDGQLWFEVEESPPGSGLLRVQAAFRLSCERVIRIGAATFDFAAGEPIRVFFSYRHTPALIERLAAGVGLRISGQWITHSGEEGVFALQRMS